jgi:hypothetical protein
LTPESIKSDFKGRVCEQIDLRQEGLNRFRVLTPFRFEDGDHFGIFLKRDGAQWVLSDEASTLMHLSYWIEEEDIESGNRQEIINGALSNYSVENRGGELVIPIPGEHFGDALFNFVQALSKVTDVSFLSRERVRSTFMEDFRTFMRSQFSDDRLAFDWSDPEHDQRKNYPVDCRINGKLKRPLFVYALGGENRVKDATIYLLRFENWGIQFQSLGIFEEQEGINPKVLARFTDVCDKTFSNLEGNQERIKAYLERVARGTRRDNHGQ